MKTIEERINMRRKETVRMMNIVDTIALDNGAHKAIVEEEAEFFRTIASPVEIRESVLGATGSSASSSEGQSLLDSVLGHRFKEFRTSRFRNRTVEAVRRSNEQSAIQNYGRGKRARPIEEDTEDKRVGPVAELLSAKLNSSHALCGSLSVSQALHGATRGFSSEVLDIFTGEGVEDRFTSLQEFSATFETAVISMIAESNRDKTVLGLCAFLKDTIPAQPDPMPFTKMARSNEQVEVSELERPGEDALLQEIRTLQEQIGTQAKLWAEKDKMILRLEKAALIDFSSEEEADSDKFGEDDDYDGLDDIFL